MTLPPSPEFLADTEPDHRAPTIDNDATTTQLELLARVIMRGGDARLRAAFLTAASSTCSPRNTRMAVGRSIFRSSRAITPTSRITTMPWSACSSCSAKRPRARALRFVDRGPPRARGRCGGAKGMACILRTQVKQDGRLTAWCAQHDEHTFAPAWARNFEPPSLSGNESVGSCEFPDGDRASLARSHRRHRGRGRPGSRRQGNRACGSTRRRARTAKKTATPSPIRPRRLCGRASTTWKRIARSICGRDNVIHYDFNEISGNAAPVTATRHLARQAAGEGLSPLASEESTAMSIFGLRAREVGGALCPDGERTRPVSRGIKPLPHFRNLRIRWDCWLDLGAVRRPVCRRSQTRTSLSRPTAAASTPRPGSDQRRADEDRPGQSALGDLR